MFVVRLRSAVHESLLEFGRPFSNMTWLSARRVVLISAALPPSPVSPILFPLNFRFTTMFTFVFLLLGLYRLSGAVFLNWNITWVNDAAPDGFNRPVIGVNGKWPPPVLEAQKGEQVTIVVWNKLGNQTTSLHWHGIRQFQTNVSIILTNDERGG